MTRFEYTYSLEYYANQAFIQTPILQNRDILEVYLDGVGRSEIVSAGTPVDQQVKYEASGKITFPSVLELGTKIVVLYQNL